MTPDERREALGDTRLNTRRYFKDSIANSSGRCSHGISLAIHCSACAAREQHERRTWRERGIGSAEWFERESAPLPGIEQVRLEDDPQYQRHTVDIKQPPPQHVEDDTTAAEPGEWWAKVVWMGLGVAFVVYVVVRIWVGGGQ